MSVIFSVYIIVYLTIHIPVALFFSHVIFRTDWWKGSYKLCFIYGLRYTFIFSLCGSVVLCLSFSPFIYLNFYLIPLGTIIHIVCHYISCAKAKDFFDCSLQLPIMMMFLAITFLFVFIFPKERFLPVTSLFTDFRRSIQSWVDLWTLSSSQSWIELWTPIYSRWYYRVEYYIWVFRYTLSNNIKKINFCSFSIRSK